MPKARLSLAERQEHRRVACAIYNAKNAETLRVKSRERMRKLRASRKKGIKVVNKRKFLVPAKGMPLIATVQKEVGKLIKTTRKVEDDQLSYDADSEASEEEGRRKLTTTPLKMGNDDGARESWHLSRGHHRAQRKASWPKYFFGRTKHGNRSLLCVFPDIESDSFDDMKPSKHGKMGVRHKRT